MTPNSKILVMLPYCEWDALLLQRSLEWQNRLGSHKGFDAVVLHEVGSSPDRLAQIVAEAEKQYGSVRMVEYPRPLKTKWPHPANWVFQFAAWLVLKDIKRPFFWMEADCIPLKAGWLQSWSDEYEACGKPIMGAIVPGMGHCNGTAVYPASFAALCPKAMRAMGNAWDWEMKEDTIHLTHNSKLMCHVWGIVNGLTHPSTGPAADFKTQADVDRWVCKDAVLFHRSKTTGLIDRLTERLK